MPYYIYTLSHPITDTLVYVGITENLRMRFRSHARCQGGNVKKNIWIGDLRKENLTPSVRVIETAQTESEARDRECYWIRCYLDSGVELFNIQSTHPPKPVTVKRPPCDRMKEKKEVTKLGVAIQQGCDHKAAKSGVKRYSIRQLARDTGIDQSHITRAMHGQVQLSRNKISAISTVLESTDIFHSAGYLSPDELDEEEAA